MQSYKFTKLIINCLFNNPLVCFLHAFALLYMHKMIYIWQKLITII